MVFIHYPCFIHRLSILHPYFISIEKKCAFGAFTDMILSIGINMRCGANSSKNRWAVKQSVIKYFFQTFCIYCCWRNSMVKTSVFKNIFSNPCGAFSDEKKISSNTINLDFY
jgi:hypothetical protein